jgi:hypothetical protein
MRMSKALIWTITLFLLARVACLPRAPEAPGEDILAWYP